MDKSYCLIGNTLYINIDIALLYYVGRKCIKKIIKFRRSMFLYATHSDFSVIVARRHCVNTLNGQCRTVYGRYSLRVGRIVVVKWRRVGTDDTNSSDGVFFFFVIV